jgi:hypothetical protein
VAKTITVQAAYRAEDEVRAADEAKRFAERTRDSKRKAVGRALAALRLAVEMPAQRVASASKVNGDLPGYIEIEDGVTWDESRARDAKDFLLRIAQGRAPKEIDP